MSLAVRRAVPADAPQVAALIQELAVSIGETSPVTAAYASGYLGFPGGNALLAEEDGQIVGLVSYSVRPSLFHAGNSALIEEMVVSESARGKSIGSVLLESLLAQLEAEGCEEVSVTTMPDNAGALGFYRSHGLVDEAVFLERHFEKAGDGLLSGPSGDNVPGKAVSLFAPSWFSSDKAVLTPSEFSAELGVETAVLCFSDRCYASLLEAFGLREAEAAPKLAGAVGGKTGTGTGRGLAVYLSSFGAPAAGMLAECLMSSGVSRLFVLGTAGSISPECRIGDIVIPTWGVREEGLSYHYLPAGTVPQPSAALAEVLRTRLLEADPAGEVEVRMGGVWTTDAIFRETAGKVREYAGRGVIAVEMECASLMSVAAYRNVDFVAVLVITDELSGDQWMHDFHGEKVQKARDTACRALARSTFL